MMSLFAAVPYLIMALLGVTFFWGSLMAFRGKKWWATLLLLIGSGGQVVAAVVLAVVMVIMLSSLTGTVATGTGPGGGSPVPTLMPFLLGAGMILYALGFILFGAGFVGFCGRSGATERRAAELEGMLADLQERMNDPS